jgi:metallopeptidase YgjP-like protein
LSSLKTNEQAGDRRVGLVELSKKHPRCLEYIVVHEMTHLLERGYGKRFQELMNDFLPDWRSRRDELNSAPLADERWVEAGDARHGAARGAPRLTRKLNRLSAR